MDDYKKVQDIVLKKVPHMLFVIQTLIANMVYGTCPQNDTYKIGFYVYFPILVVLCGVWYGISSYQQLKKDYPNENKSVIVFTIVSIVESMVSLMVASAAMLGGKPYSCYYGYNPVVATVVLLIWGAIIATIGYFQHMYLHKYPTGQSVPVSYLECN